MEHTFLIDSCVLVLEKKKFKKNAKNFLPIQYFRSKLSSISRPHIISHFFLFI